MLVTMSDKELVRAQVIQSVCEKRLRRRDAAGQPPRARLFLSCIGLRLNPYSTENLKTDIKKPGKTGH
jgi:hypothetical protein